jgi:hypothetical protein
MTGKNRRPQPLVVTQAQMARAVRALEQSKTPFAGFRIHPDGSVDVLAGEPLAAADDGPSDWDRHLGIIPPRISQGLQDLAAWKKKHGYPD